MKQTLIFAVIGFTCFTRFTAAEGADRVSFNRDIRPILSDACFQCHGPDDKQRKSGLRLDLQDSGRKPAESGAIAIVPGHPETSELVQRLVSTDENLSMPPRKSGKKLTAAQMELLKRWIAEGAEYQGHWAFIPPEIPTVPAVNDPRHEIVNPIDAFVRSRLGPAGLTPAPAADKSTLIRRVSLDLTGLPPTPAEVGPSSRTTRPMPTKRWSTDCCSRRGMVSEWLSSGSTLPAMQIAMVFKSTAVVINGLGGIG